MENLKQLVEQRKKQYKSPANEIINIYWMIAVICYQGMTGTVINHHHEYKHTCLP